MAPSTPKAPSGPSGMARAPYIVSNKKTIAIIPSVAATRPSEETRIHFLTRSVVSARSSGCDRLEEVGETSREIIHCGVRLIPGLRPGSVGAEGVGRLRSAQGGRDRVFSRGRRTSNRRSETRGLRPRQLPKRRPPETMNTTMGSPSSSDSAVIRISRSTT